MSVEVSYSSVKGPWSDVANAGLGLPPPPPPPLDWPGVGNIGSDPLFVDPLAGDYHLLPTSPCIDAGHNGALPPGLTEDLDGNPRIVNIVVDMGAYEAVNTPEKVLEYIAETIADIEPENLNNPNSSNALANKINATLVMIKEGRYGEALDKLQNDILKKTDGCVETGQPDKNDWIVTCEAQAKVYPLILRTIELLERLLPQ